MPVTETAFAKINLALAAAIWLAACSPVEEPTSVTSEDQACERVMAVLAANKTYPAEQMASCDGGRDDARPGFYVLRVNAHCREPLGCGSVLLGWYAVDAKSGAVFEMDAAEWQVGSRIDRKD